MKLNIQDNIQSISKKHIFLLGCGILLLPFKSIGQSVLVPKQANEFIRIYEPSADYYSGPSTNNLEENKWYGTWVPNDHAFVKGNDGKWHIFGITHPLVETKPLATGIHEGENVSFHAISSAQKFKKTLKNNHYTDLPKVLSPKERPLETVANHAPYIVKKDNLFHMIYGPSPIRLAVSYDLSNWELKGALFSEIDGARDPNILFHDGIYYVIYCSKREVRLRKSSDLINWSDSKTIFSSNEFDPESPSLIYFNNSFYLFVCSWDGIWDQKDIQGAYQFKTYVYNSNQPTDFGIGNQKEIGTLNAHAPEIFQGENEQWYISSVEWPFRGVSVDKLYWNKDSLNK